MPTAEMGPQVVLVAPVLGHLPLHETSLVQEWRFSLQQTNEVEEEEG